VRAQDRVNYAVVAALKLRVLHLLYAEFVKVASPERRLSLKDFVQHGGESLKQFCPFQAIRFDLVSRNQPNDLQHWPEELRDLDSPGTQNFVVRATAKI
jgi:4-alpha-glucanotransferase